MKGHKEAGTFVAKKDRDDKWYASPDSSDGKKHFELSYDCKTIAITLLRRALAAIYTCGLERARAAPAGGELRVRVRVRVRGSAGAGAAPRNGASELCTEESESL